MSDQHQNHVFNQTQSQKAVDHGWLRLPAINITVTGPIYVGDPAFQEKVLNHLQAIEAKERKIMSQLDDANAAIEKIKTETDNQGVVLAQEATTLQQISDNQDALLAKLGAPGVTPEEVAALTTQLQAQADAAAQVSASIKQHADFATAIASKGVANPVPVPVPTPTPAPVTP